MQLGHADWFNFVYFGTITATVWIFQIKKSCIDWSIIELILAKILHRHHWKSRTKMEGIDFQVKANVWGRVPLIYIILNEQITIFDKCVKIMSK